MALKCPLFIDLLNIEMYSFNDIHPDDINNFVEWRHKRILKKNEMIHIKTTKHN